MTTVAELHKRLEALHERTRKTPLFNPVFQLGLEFSREIEAGKFSLVDVENLVSALECEGLIARADRLRRLASPVEPAANRKILERRAGEADTFEAFAAHWAKPAVHVVATAHPTFLLTPAQAEAVAAAASLAASDAADVCAAPPAREAITLATEHDQAMAALARAQAARDNVNRILLAEARKRWPDRWRQITPLPFRFATWVGYDMDGRTDIGWQTSLHYRLAEKAERLASYAAMLTVHAPDLSGQLARSGAHAESTAQRFTEDLTEPAAVSEAANALTAGHRDKLVSLAPVIAELETRAAVAPDDVAEALLVAAAAMRADGLGMGWIHFRVNASQLQNAIRRRIDPDGKLDLASQAAMVRVRELLAEVRPLRANFAALAIENSTAMRQFLAMVQILNHVDADAPIRMLVAECEQPATMLAALYFARLYGIEDKVDVSPLFETESALEHGGRFLDSLLGEPAYRDYARTRGRVAIQTGFSDAGRFVGQIPAALAIERLQGRLARAMAANGLGGQSALIFNTHGESMGRGAHPSSFADRLTWPLSPWVRGRFAQAGVAIEPEVSFQGGDGYLFFGSDELAFATLTRLIELPPAVAVSDASADTFYRRTDISLDFYRAIRDVQHGLLIGPAYPRALTAFGLGLLNETGSRMSRRQSDIAGDRAISLRQIRAIPHNAVLQQLGYPVNVIAGFGTAAEANVEEVAGLLGESERGRQLVRLVRAANDLASIKTVAAFGELFNSAYWASRPYRGDEPHIADGCLALAEHLNADDRAEVFRRLASQLRVDGLKLHRLLALIPDEAPDPARERRRRSLGVLQALRLALFQHMFLRAAMLPQFSRANDIAREDVLEMVFTLRIDEAVAQLRRAFPVSAPSIADFDVAEPTDYPDDGGAGYGAIQGDFVDAIAHAQELALRIGTAIANQFGAHG